MLTRSVRHSLSTENQEMLEDMSEKDFVPQRNLTVASDESPVETDVKVELLLKTIEILSLQSGSVYIYLFIYL